MNYYSQHYEIYTRISAIGLLIIISVSYIMNVKLNSFFRRMFPDDKTSSLAEGGSTYPDTEIPNINLTYRKFGLSHKLKTDLWRLVLKSSKNYYIDKKHIYLLVSSDENTKEVQQLVSSLNEYARVLSDLVIVVHKRFGEDDFREYSNNVIYVKFDDKVSYISILFTILHQLLLWNVQATTFLFNCTITSNPEKFIFDFANSSLLVNGTKIYPYFINMAPSEFNKALLHDILPLLYMSNNAETTLLDYFENNLEFISNSSDRYIIKNKRTELSDVSYLINATHWGYKDDQNPNIYFTFSDPALERAINFTRST